MTGPVLIYNSSNSKHIATVEVSLSGMKFLQIIWDQCNSPEYYCSPQIYYSATFNCIGWALGVSKWLNPSEITSYIEEGFSKSEAIEKFILDKSSKYNNNDLSNFDKIINKFDSFSFNLRDNPTNNTVSFFFKDGKCTHGSRFLDTINENNIENWTSKLGINFLISHDLDDLTGTKSFYGNELYYASISRNLTDLKEEL